MGYQNSFKVFLCLSVIFLFSMKIMVLEKYFEKINFTAFSIHTTKPIRKGAHYWFSQTNKHANKNITLPNCTLPPDLGPYNIQLNVPLDNEFKNERMSFGGHNKPENCIALQKIAIVIPFRNRESHLKIWLHNMHPFLQKQQADYGIYVIEQHGNLPFNRAKLLNIGYKEALKEYDYNCFIFSDVDIIPMDQRNLYRCSTNPKHMAHALDKFNFRLLYATLFGGVVAFTKEQFLKVNGFSNLFWGWGGEDDDLYKRVITAGMQIERMNNIISKTKAIPHKRDPGNEDNPKSEPLLEKAARRMYTDGLNSLNYTFIRVMKHRLYTKVLVDIGKPENIEQ
ncbi:hypothetical protein GDO81_001020 [Engystomops pustulosus]|uniref:Beta-1,4-galactosyltransferase n=1 Tax=Engystomops pustulosus TaxID=76066 RepID=A0AAV7DAZ8_ENGPU|nr:hypothetical protein GDO81_001020 [Engystomops pustulosus]